MAEDIIHIIEKHYKEKIDQTQHDFQIGVELEFPIIKVGGHIIDIEVIKKLAFFIVEELGFNQITMYSDKIPVKMRNPLNQDLISFEYCFSNLEFSLAPALKLDDFTKRFWDYYEKITDFLARRDHLLISQGTNPYKWAEKVPILQSDYIKAACTLAKRKRRNSAYNIDHWLSIITSVQTHIHLREEKFADVVNLLNKSEWINGLLFSNSGFWNGKTDPFLNMCSRDCFWQDNGYVSKELDHPVADNHFSDIYDYYRFFIEKIQIVYVVRDKKYISLENMNITDYYNSESIRGKVINGKNDLKDIVVQPKDGDLDYFRLYFYNVLTVHGTLEMRSDCIQPLKDTFAPVAFNIGVASNYNKIKKYMDFITIKNSILRIKATKYHLNKEDWEFLKMPIKDFLYGFYDLVKQGLVQRGYGEEKHIECLVERIDKLESPAIRLINSLKDGEDLNSIITRNNKRNYL